MKLVKTPLTIHQRFNDIAGNEVASAITLSLFLSMFPLIVVGVSVLGFVAAGNDDFVLDVIDSMNLKGSARDFFVQLVDSAESNRASLGVFGFVSGAWSALGISGAVQQAANRPWQVTGMGLRDKLKGLIFIGGSIASLGAALLTTNMADRLPIWAMPISYPPISYLLSVALDFGGFLLLFWLLCTYRLPFELVWPGALAGTVGMQVLKWMASNWLPGVIARSEGAWGPIGIILGVFAWLMLLGKLLVYASTLNVVLAERRHGTAEMTILTPNLGDPFKRQQTNRLGAVAPPSKPFRLPWQKPPPTEAKATNQTGG